MSKKGMRKRGGILQTFVRKWHEPTPGVPPESKVYISKEEIRHILTSALEEKLANNYGFYTADDFYYCPPMADIKEIIRNSSVDTKTYVKERFDCDDFALILKAHFVEAGYADGSKRRAHCFGIVWGYLPHPNYHAMNWVIDENKELWFVEPQNDRIFKPRRGDKDIYFLMV